MQSIDTSRIFRSRFAPGVPDIRNDHHRLPAGIETRFRLNDRVRFGVINVLTNSPFFCARDRNSHACACTKTYFSTRASEVFNRSIDA
jgi:hypothetical protein